MSFEGHPRKVLGCQINYGNTFFEGAPSDPVGSPPPLNTLDAHHSAKSFWQMKFKTTAMLEVLKKIIGWFGLSRLQGPVF